MAAPACAGQQAVEQRSAPVPGSRVHHQPGGLVDDQQVFVFVHRGKRHGFGHEGTGLQR
jgi:hypothetical protein